jgi:hypothetical protein
MRRCSGLERQGLVHLGLKPGAGTQSPLKAGWGMRYTEGVIHPLPVGEGRGEGNTVHGRTRRR